MKTKETNPQPARRFNKSVRYIDDLLNIKHDGLMNKYMSDIYPKELELKHENSQNDQHTAYLDLEINVVNNEIVTSLYDKHDDFPFTVVISLTCRVTFHRMHHLSLIHISEPTRRS